MNKIIERLTIAYKTGKRRLPKTKSNWDDIFLIASSKDRVIAEWVEILKEQSGITEIGVASSIGRYAILTPKNHEEKLRNTIEECLPSLKEYYLTIEGPQEFPSFYGPDRHPQEGGLMASWYTTNSQGYLRLVPANTNNETIKARFKDIDLSSVIEDQFLDSLTSFQRGCIQTWADTLWLFFQWDCPLSEVKGLDIIPECIKSRIPESFIERVKNEDSKRLPHGEKEIHGTEYLVNANDAEQHYLWQHWAKEAYFCRRLDEHENHLRLSWIQGKSLFRQIGKLDNRPVCININWNCINGHLIGFWYMSSQVTDSKMANDWLKKTFPNLKSKNTDTDSLNFHSVIHSIKE